MKLIVDDKTSLTVEDQKGNILFQHISNNHQQNIRIYGKIISSKQLNQLINDTWKDSISEEWI